MKRSAQILIVDKIGIIGELLSLKLSKEFPVALISKWRRLPKIPDNKYSHIVLIEEEESEKKFLSRIIKRARQINSDFIFAQMLSAKGKYVFDKVFKEYSSAKAVLYGDIFIIRDFIKEAKKSGSIHISGEGLTKKYPVLADDVASGLIEIIFGTNNSRSLSYLFSHPTTELSLAHMIQKANPDIKVDFIKQNKKKEISFPAGGKYMLGDYPLAKKIRGIDIEKFSVPRGKRQSGKSRRFLFSVIWTSLFLLLSPLIFTFVFSLLGLGTLYFARSYLEKGNLAYAKSSLNLSQTFFYAGKKASEILFLEGKIIGKEENLRRLQEDIDLGYKVSLALSHAFNSGVYFERILNGKSKNPADDFVKGQSNLKSSIIILEEIKTEGKIPAAEIEKTKSIDALINLVSRTSDVLPDLFGLEGQRTYLVLFQNNMELRPGGGFIGSYGILKLNMGRIAEFSIHDVYDADGQLRGHVEPPFALRRYLPLPHWYMRDSNFDVDFVKSASISSNFLYVETGISPDGVIGVDVSFVKSILRAIGPVNVSDYKEIVTENNFFELTEAHSEKNFFPGSTQKKDFLRSLYRAMLAKISSGNVSYFSILQAISDSLMEKHVVFAFNNNIQNIFTVNGWSSSLFDERKENENSINDFLGISEANLGVNKVNYAINRNLSQKTTIDNDGKVSSEMTLSYKNTSKVWPGGDYKNYLRIILPIAATISAVSINDDSQILVDAVTDSQIYEKDNFKAPTGLEVEKTTEENKAIYGFLINVPVGEVVKIKIKYDLAKKVSLNTDDFSYNLKLFKQPGVDNIPYSLSLVYPSSFNIIKGQETYSKNLTKDENLIIDFAKK